MAAAKYNLQVLKRSRTKPKAGDIFVIRPIKHDYYFGRVINPNARILSWGGVLAYVYDIHSPEKRAPAVLSKARLLIPPRLLAFPCWTMGLAETIDHRELTEADILVKHCFYDVPFKRYVDENGTPLKRRIEPCGTYGITTPLGLGEHVSDALKIPFDED
jgi:Immunity protein 26